MSIREGKSRHVPANKNSRFQRAGLFVLASFLLQDDCSRPLVTITRLKQATSVSNFASRTDFPQVIIKQPLNSSTDPSIPRKIPGKDGQKISRIRSDHFEKKHPSHGQDSFLHSNVIKADSKALIKGSLSNLSQALEKENSSLFLSSQNVSSPKFHLESSLQLINNASYYSTNTQNRPSDSTPTRRLANRSGNSNKASELHLLTNKIDLRRRHDSRRKSADNVPKTYIKYRKKKRRKYSSKRKNEQHRSNFRRHHRKEKLHRHSSVDSKSKENKFTKQRRSLQLSSKHPLLLAVSERALLRFKRDSDLEEDGGRSMQKRKKRKRRKRRHLFRRHAKRRSVRASKLSNVIPAVPRRGYPLGSVWTQTSLTRNAKGFVSNRNVIPQASYGQLTNRGQVSPYLLNPYMARSNGYDWRKSAVAESNKPSSSPIASSRKFVQSDNKLKNMGTIQLVPYSPNLKKPENQLSGPVGLQNAAVITQQASLQQQQSNQINSNGLSRKQFIPNTQGAVYSPVSELKFQPQLLPFAHDNPQGTRYPQLGLALPQIFPRVRPVIKDWSAVSPGTNSHVITNDDAPRRSRVPQGLIMYLNFEDVVTGRAPYASFYGDLAGAAKRTEISRSFGSCGRIARINNGSEILLNGGKMKIKPLQAVSIAAWIKLDTNRGYHSIFDTVGGHSLHKDGQYHFEIQDGKIRWFHRNESGVQVFSVETDPIIPANIWNHIVGTYEALTGIAKVFVNGRLKAEAAGKGLLSQDWDAHAGIGKHKNGRFLQGQIDEFRIYNKALSQEEILNLMKICRFQRDCGGFFNSPSGIIESPDWPHHYKGKTVCTWHISVDPGDKIALRFYSFSLDEDGTCDKAKLVVRDGYSDDANVLGVYCGNSRPPELTSTGSRLWLQFSSTERAEGKGFLLNYDTASSRQAKKTERPPTPVENTQRCAVTRPQYNVTLIGGIKSGTFSEAQHVKDMDLCTRHCCLRKQCDLAFMIRDSCYLVQCANEMLCKTKKARPSNMNPRISFVSHLQSATPEPEIPADVSAFSKATTPSVTTAPSTPPLKVQPVCHHTAVSYNVTLVGGINAGKFSTYGGSRSMDECIRHCCHDDKCDVAFMIQGNCYAVECADIEGCQVKRAKPSAYHPTVAYVYRGYGRPIGDPLPGADKPNVDACSKLSVSNTIYNVTLRGGIKAGNFTDKGVVKNMDECSAFCCADERCSVAFLIRDNCFLVECKDYDSCKMKPALSEYYHPRLAYVNWSPPDDEIPENRWYASLGCWKDTESFAVGTLEGSDALLQGSYVTREKPIDTCAQVARKHDYKVFAIQNGGACLGGPTAGRMFNQFGESSACKDGKGGLFVNDVYRLTDSGSYVSLGCWNDSAEHAVPLLEHSDPRLDDVYQARSDPILKCGQVARRRGFTVFALQRGGMCFGGPRAEIDYQKYGISRKCHDGLGGSYANSVYRLIDNLEIKPTASTENITAPTTGSSASSDSPTGSSASSDSPTGSSTSSSTSSPTGGSSSTASNDFTPTSITGTQRSPSTSSPSPTPLIQEDYLTLQDGLPHKNTYSAGDILYNVTLKYGIKAGKFSDRGKVGNMSECVRGCGRLESCSLAFMLGKQCFAVSCYNDALCLTKPAYSPFYKPKIAFVKHTKEVVTAKTPMQLSQFNQCRTSIVHNDVTLVGGINAGKFTDLGDADNMSICTQRCCMKDACDVAFMLEGECYGVACSNESLCETRPARNPARYNPRIVYVYHDKRKDKALRRPKLKALIKMIDRLLYEKPQKQTEARFTPVDDKNVDATDFAIDSDASDDVSNDIPFLSNTLASGKPSNSKKIDETYSTDVFAPTIPPVHYEKLVGNIKNGQMNVYALPFLFKGSEVPENLYKSYGTPLPSKGLNDVSGYYVKTPQSSNFDEGLQVGVSPAVTLGGSGRKFQQSDLTNDEEINELLQEWFQEQSNNKNDKAIAGYYDGTYNDLLSLNNADLNSFSNYLKLRLSQSQGSTQDDLTNRFPLHVHENTQQIAQQINSLLGVSSSATDPPKSVCWDGEILYNYTLVGGINAGTFTDNGKTSNMDICMQFCCKRDSCDLAFMIEDDCYSVACNSNGACVPRKARPTHYSPRIAIRKKPQGDSRVEGVTSSTSATESTPSTPTPSPSSPSSETSPSSQTPASSPLTSASPLTELQGASVDPTIKVTHSCDATPIEYNVTLKMGLHSGVFQKIGRVESMDDCIELSCKQSNSDVAFMLGSMCFAVNCYSADLCKTVPIFGSSISRLNLNPAISFLRKKSRFGGNSLVQNDVIGQDKCRDSTITYNVTLRGGIEAGNFTERSGALNMRDCIGKCCDDTTCDLAFMFGDSCYSVECRSERLCQAVLAKPSNLEPKVSYVTRGYFDDKDKGTMLSANDQTPTCRADQKSRSTVVSNKTLVGGLEAGKFSFAGVVSDMAMCMDRCCAQRDCNVAYMVDKNCFSVACYSPSLCKISDEASTNGDVEISTIMNSTTERPTEKNSMLVYVVIGVVGFAAGAGGILWAVCMFVRRHRLRSRHRQDTE